MKKRLWIILGLLVLLLIMAFESIFEDRISSWFTEPTLMEMNNAQVKEIESDVLIHSNHEKKGGEVQAVKKHKSFLGMTAQEVLNEYGQPDRKDPSSFGYEWWIYHNDETSYVQIGIEQEQVVTVFLAGEINGSYVSIGETYDEISKHIQFEKKIDITTSEGVYQFKLSSDDLNMRPLVRFGDEWVQLYFDSFTNELSSIRLLTDEILLRQRPYSITYRGPLPAWPNFSEEERFMIEKGNAKQIFDYTNVIRERHHLDALMWEEEVAFIAYLHSKDMSENNYFSHTSPTFGELANRFSNQDISFMLAGENIAAKYVDGLAAVEGWLNSEGHRVNLLHEEFTHLGVGVYRDYYTQNFMTPWDIN